MADQERKPPNLTDELIERVRGFLKDLDRLMRPQPQPVPVPVPVGRPYPRPR